MRVKSFLNSLLSPTITIHSWGGFGSQLFTAYLVLKLQHYHPKRRLRVVVHTSGVTRRDSELDFRVLGVEMIEKDDFSPKIDTVDIKFNNVSQYFSRKIKNLGKKSMLKLGFLCTLNDDRILSSIKPWTISIRGHYTQMSFDPSSIAQLYSLIRLPEYSDLQNRYGLVIHYRLGDLLYIEQKDPIEPQRIGLVVNQIAHTSHGSILLTDSDPLESRAYIHSIPMLNEVEIENLPPRSTLMTCVHANDFVGTNAKLSLWSAVFRQFLFNKNSFLPVELSWSEKNLLHCHWY